MTQNATLAEQLDEAANTAAAIPQLSASVSVSVDDAYEIQKLSIDRRIERAEKLVGLKLGFTSRAKMIQMGVDDMIWGRLTDRMMIEDVAFTGRTTSGQNITVNVVGPGGNVIGSRIGDSEKNMMMDVVQAFRTKANFNRLKLFNVERRYGSYTVTTNSTMRIQVASPRASSYTGTSGGLVELGRALWLAALGTLPPTGAIHGLPQRQHQYNEHVTHGPGSYTHTRAGKRVKVLGCSELSSSPCHSPRVWSPSKTSKRRTAPQSTS